MVPATGRGSSPSWLGGWRPSGRVGRRVTVLQPIGVRWPGSCQVSPRARSPTPDVVAGGDIEVESELGDIDRREQGGVPEVQAVHGRGQWPTPAGVAG